MLTIQNEWNFCSNFRIQIRIFRCNVNKKLVLYGKMIDADSTTVFDSIWHWKTAFRVKSKLMTLPYECRTWLLWNNNQSLQIKVMLYWQTLFAYDTHQSRRCVWYILQLRRRPHRLHLYLHVKPTAFWRTVCPCDMI